MNGAVIYKGISLLFIISLLISIHSCKEEKIHKSYREIEIIPKVSANTAPGGQVPKVAQPVNTGGLVWQKPEGWTEEKGSGMRLTTFFFNDNNKTAECTIVMLSGAAGGLESNVKRWMKQLDLVIPTEEKLQAFLEKQERITTHSGYSGVIVDFSNSLSGSLISSNTSFSAVINMKNSTVFVKLVGDKSLLNKNKKKFIELCKSLKFKG